jgi:hypothetical protein
MPAISNFLVLVWVGGFSLSALCVPRVRLKNCSKTPKRIVQQQNKKKKE